MAEARIVVVGAGVAGLTTALTLSSHARYDITLAAKYMPGDYDIEYTSTWAGANYQPTSRDGTLAAECDLQTWPHLERLARHHPEAGVHFQENVTYTREKDESSVHGASRSRCIYSERFKSMIPNYKQIPQDRLPPGYDAGISFTSVCINTALYLPWLLSQCLKAGVVVRRRVFTHISEAAQAHHSGKQADLVVNCTGLGAGKLGGVEDKEMVPVRGQTVLVRNDPGIMCQASGTEDGADEMAYIMQRAAGGGTILGGCYQLGNWESQVDPNLAVRIMKRAVDLCPSITGGKGIEHLSVIRHNVGLRPLRLSGTRLEKEKIGELWVVHNYGHGGYGYQSSYGCSQVAAELADDALTPKSKL